MSDVPEPQPNPVPRQSRSWDEWMVYLAEHPEVRVYTTDDKPSRRLQQPNLVPRWFRSVVEGAVFVGLGLLVWLITR